MSNNDHHFLELIDFTWERVSWKPWKWYFKRNEGVFTLYTSNKLEIFYPLVKVTPSDS